MDHACAAYRYTESARSRGLKNLPIGIGFLLLGAVFWAVPHPAFWVAGALFALGGAGAFLFSLVWVLGGGVWDISIRENEIVWNAPALSEGPFRYRFDQIQHIKKRIKTKLKESGKKKIKVRYWLVGPTKSHDLSPQSGVDVDEVVRLLTEGGVRIEEEHVERSD